MKTSTFVCAVLAGSLGLGSVASAQDWRFGGRDDHRGDRYEQRQDRREARADRREERRERQATRVDRAWERGYHAGNRDQPYYVQQPRHVQQPRYVQQPSYVVTQPDYRHYASRFHRGGYLPAQYLSHGYYVNDWNAYPGLYAPPYGHQWVQVGSDFLLVALATGLIANLLSQ